MASQAPFMHPSSAQAGGVCVSYMWPLWHQPLSISSRKPATSSAPLSQASGLSPQPQSHGCSLGACGLHPCGGACDRPWDPCGQRSTSHGTLLVMEKMSVGSINKWGESHKIIMGAGSTSGPPGHCSAGGVAGCPCGSRTQLPALGEPMIALERVFPLRKPQYTMVTVCHDHERFLFLFSAEEDSP